MDFLGLFNKVKEVSENETMKKAVKKIANSEKVKTAVSKAKKALKDVEKKANKTKKKVSLATKAVKVADALGINAKSIASLATKNKDVIAALVKLGIQKEYDIASTKVQNSVKSLKTSINKATGAKIGDEDFGSIVSKLLANDKVKTQLQKAAGSGVISFVKKAVAEYIS